MVLSQYRYKRLTTIPSLQTRGSGRSAAHLLCRQAQKVGRKYIQEESTVPYGTEHCIPPFFYRPVFPTGNFNSTIMLSALPFLQQPAPIFRGEVRGFEFVTRI